MHPFVHDSILLVRALKIDLLGHGPRVLHCFSLLQPVLSSCGLSDVCVRSDDGCEAMVSRGQRWPPCCESTASGVTFQKMIFPLAFALTEGPCPSSLAFHVTSGLALVTRREWGKTSALSTRANPHWPYIRDGIVGVGGWNNKLLCQGPRISGVSASCSLLCPPWP